MWWQRYCDVARKHLISDIELGVLEDSILVNSSKRMKRTEYFDYIASRGKSERTMKESRETIEGKIVEKPIKELEYGKFRIWKQRDQDPKEGSKDWGKTGAMAPEKVPSECCGTLRYAQLRRRKVKCHWCSEELCSSCMHWKSNPRFPYMPPDWKKCCQDCKGDDFLDCPEWEI